VRGLSVREDELFLFFLFVLFQSAEELAEEEEGRRLLRLRRRFLAEDVFLFSSVFSDLVVVFFWSHRFHRWKKKKILLLWFGAFSGWRF